MHFSKQSIRLLNECDRHNFMVQVCMSGFHEHCILRKFFLQNVGKIVDISQERVVVKVCLCGKHY